MSDCTDKRFEEMISAFELDVLTDQEKREFSMHLMECEGCFEKVQKFKNEARLLRHDPNLRKEVLYFTEKQLVKDEDVSPEEDLIIPWWKRRMKFIPAIVLTAAVLIILILKPWHIEFHPSKEVIASENRLAILYFENVVDPEDPQHLGEIAANLLISDLSESHYMQVVSSYRLYDVLKLIGKEGLKKIEKEIALDVARTAEARWMLTGSILQSEPQMIISSMLIEVSSGDVQASQKVVGDEGDNIFALIDKLTIKVKHDLALPEEALREPDRPVAEVTTISQEAYQYYLEGLEYNQKFYIEEAIRCFEKALEYDSTFAMVYFQLAGIKDKNLIYKALEYIDNVGQIDRYYLEVAEAEMFGDIARKQELLESIIGRYPDEKNAYYLLGINESSNGRYKRANEYLNEAVKIDPLFKTAFNQMVYNYNYVGNFEKALWAVDKYIEIAPDEANPYDTKADLYASNGMIDNAAENYRTALKIKPDYLYSLAKLSLLYIYQGEYQLADSCLNVVHSKGESNFQHLAGIYKCYVLLIQGKLDQGLELIDSLMLASEVNHTNLHFIRAQIYVEMENWELAIEEMEKTIQARRKNNPDKKVDFVYMYSQVLAESGNFIKAEEKAEEIKEIEQTEGLTYYWYAVGSIAYAKGSFGQAAEHFGKLKDLDERFFIQYMYAKSLLFDNQIDSAIDIMESLSKKYNSDRALFNIWSTTLYYYLGLAYESKGRYDDAVLQYEIFLNIWKDADQNLKSKYDAEERVQHLKSRS